MAIAYDATSNGSGGSSYSFSHTCTGSNRILIVTTSTGASSGTSTVTYNGVSLTQQASRNGGYHQIWVLIAPATGTNTIQITTAGANGQAVATSYTGVAQTGNPEATNGANSGSAVTTINSSVTTLTDNAWVIASCSYDSFPNSQNAGTGSTQRAVRSASLSGGQSIGLYDNGSAKTPAGSVSMTVNASAGSGIMDIYQMALKPFIQDYPITISQGSFIFTGLDVILAKGVQYALSLIGTSYSYTGYTLSFVLRLYNRVTNLAKSVITGANISKNSPISPTNVTKNEGTWTNQTK